MELLPYDIKNKIREEFPPQTKLMMLNKDFYHIGLNKYCEHFDPTDSQILKYFKNHKHCALFEMKYKYDSEMNMVNHMYISNIKPLGKILFHKYHDLNIGGQYSYDSMVRFYEHKYYDLDLNSLYHLCLQYCNEASAKKIIVDKLHYMRVMMIDYENNDDPDEEDEDTMDWIFIYMMVSANLLGLWTEQYLYTEKIKPYQVYTVFIPKFNIIENLYNILIDYYQGDFMT